MSDIDVGSIMVEVWGYDQTNVTFYEVMKRTPKTVNLQRVKARVVDTDAGRRLVAVPGDPDTRFDRGATRGVFRRTLDRFDRVNITDYSRARLWDGTPMYDTITNGEPGH